MLSWRGSMRRSAHDGDGCRHVAARLAKAMTARADGRSRFGPVRSEKGAGGGRNMMVADRQLAQYGHGEGSVGDALDGAGGVTCAPPIDRTGYGTRVEVWTQTCSIGCAGCISRDTREPAAADQFVVVRQLLEWIISHGSVDGLTMSGGESFEQPGAVTAVAYRFSRRHRQCDRRHFALFRVLRCAGAARASRDLWPCRCGDDRTLCVRAA